MTDITAETNEAPEVDNTADDARYAEMEQRISEKEAPADDQPAAEEVEKPAEREPLAREELESRLSQTKAAMKEERARARELKGRLEALEAQQVAKAQEDPFEALIASLSDDEDDPIGDIASVKRILKEFQARQQAETTQEATTRQQQTALQGHLNAVAEQEAEFREDNPDYDDASKYFRESLRSELEERGFKGQELEQEFAKELIGLTQKAIGAGRNPAEVAYALAKKRGFGTAQVATVDKTTEKLQTLNKGQQAGRSLSTVGGKSGDGTLTAASVANGPRSQVLAGYEKLKQQAKRTGNYR